MVKNFKIVIVAIGKPELVKADWFTEGQIIVDAGEENPVHLVLHNAAISSQDGPAIYAPSCS